MSEGYVGAIWRFPVVGMRGERLRSAHVGPRGLAGDRRHHATGPQGPLLAHDLPRLARWTATYPFNPDGALLPEEAPPFPLLTAPGGLHSWRWGDPRLSFALDRDLDRHIELVRDLDAARGVIVAAAAPAGGGAAAGINVQLSLALPDGGWAGRDLNFRDGVRLRLVSSRRDGPGIEARVIEAGRLLQGEPVRLG